MPPSSLRRTTPPVTLSIRQLVPLLAVPALAGALAAGCEAEPADLTLQICGDVRVPRQVDALRFEVLDANREVVDSRVLELLVCPAGDVRELPVSADFEMREGTTWVAVEGLQEGERVSRYERRLQLEGDDTSRDVRLAVQEACLGVISCSESETCAAGRCRPIPREENEPAECRPTLLADARGAGDTGPDTGSSAGDAADATGDAGDAEDRDTFDPRSLCPSYDAGTPDDADDATELP